MAHWPGGLPELYTQLDTGAATEGEDCGPLACVNSIVLATDGKVGPRRQGEVEHWVQLVRHWAGNATKPFQFDTDFMQVLKHPDLHQLLNRSGIAGLQPQAAGRWDTMKRHARANYPVILAVNYGVLNDGKAPSGDPRFRGGHALVIAGTDVRNRLVYANIGDSLFDGRRAGIPDGYTEARLRYYRSAAARFGKTPPGTGWADFITVRGGSH